MDGPHIGVFILTCFGWILSSMAASNIIESVMPNDLSKETSYTLSHMNLPNHHDETPWSEFNKETFNVNNFTNASIKYHKHHHHKHHHTRNTQLPKQSQLHRKSSFTVYHHKHKSRKTRRHDTVTTTFQEQHRPFSQVLQHEKEPAFDHSMPSFVTAQLGSAAFLSCRIHLLDDKTVSWIRNRDAHILTIDRYTFIADSRFSTWYDSKTETWTLQIKFTSPEDAGKYECQVSTEPKMSHFITLAVITPRVEIPGGSELHVRSGSDVVLKCVISGALTLPPYVFWYHEDLRNIDGSIGNIIHQGPIEQVSPDTCIASLDIKNVRRKHAGNYTCAPAGIVRSDSVLLHVINGEHPAAMQHGRNSGSRNCPASTQFYFIFTLFSFYFTSDLLEKIL